MAKFETILIGGCWDGKTARATNDFDYDETTQIQRDQQELKFAVSSGNHSVDSPLPEGPGGFQVLRYIRRRFGLNGMHVDAFVAEGISDEDAASRLTKLWKDGKLTLWPKQLIEAKQAG